MKSPNSIKKWSVAYRVEIFGTVEVDAVNRLQVLVAFFKLPLQRLYDSAKVEKIKVISSCPINDMNDKEVL